MRDRLPVVIAAVVALVPTAGCMSYRPVPPLDDAERAELATLAPRMAATRVRIVAAPDDDLHGADDVADALHIVGVSTSATDAAITVVVSGPLRGECGSIVNVLSLGLIPDKARGRTEYRWRLLAADGRETATTLQMESPAWVGWLVGPVALLPGWKLSATWKKDEQEQEERSPARRDRLALTVARSINVFVHPK